MVQFKKHNWLKYGRFGNMAKIEIFDDTERRIDKFICNDNNGYNKALKLIEQKYGFKLEPTIRQEESINQINGQEKKEIKDKDWLGKDLEW